MQLNVNYLKAAAIVTGKEEVRYYLKGVAIQANEEGVFIIATDGHRALAFRQSDSYQGQPIDIIIPTEIVTSLKTKEETVELTNVSQWALGNLLFKPIEGTFPDWRRIIPSSVSNETAQFNYSYVGDFAKVAKALGKGTPVHIAHNGNGPALITFGTDIDGIGLLMPMRVQHLNSGNLPVWVNHKEETQTLAA
jgi:DNA polymerase-3 subunit beta